MIFYRESRGFLGRMLTLSSKDIEVQVTLDVGPRIISLRYLPDGENIFFEDVNDLINKDVSKDYGVGQMWHIYGGTRMWLAPEFDHSYVPDNSPVQYRKMENGAVFLPNRWEKHQVQPRLIIEFEKEDRLKIKMQATSYSEKIKPLSVWNLSVCKPGGTLVVPLSQENTGYLPNKNIVHWPYNDLADPRYVINNRAIFMVSNKVNKNPLKIGAFIPTVIAQYLIGKSIFIIETNGPKEAIYPDMYCNFESYTNDLIHEIETLSPIENIGPGETISHEEIWTIKKAKKSWIDMMKTLELAAPECSIIYD